MTGRTVLQAAALLAAAWVFTGLLIAALGSVAP